MNKSRLLTVSLLLLLLLAAAGFYLHRNLDNILQQQVREAFREFGVLSYKLEGTSLRGSLFTADQLRLLGRYGQYDYDISLSALEIRYDWRSLLSRQVQSVDLANLAATITDHGADPSSAPREATSIEVGSLLPQELLATLPTQALAIKSLQLKYRSRDVADVRVTGALAYRERLDLSLALALDHSQVTVVAHSGEQAGTLNAQFAVASGDTPIASLSAELAPRALRHWEWTVEGHWSNAPVLSWIRNFIPEILPNTLAATGRGAVTARFAHPESLTIEPGPLWPQLHKLEAHVELTDSITALNYPGYITGLKGELALTLTLSAGRLRASLGPGDWNGLLANVALAIPDGTVKWLQWDKDIPGHLAVRQPLLIEFDGAQWTGHADNILLELGNSRSNLALNNLQLTASMGTEEHPAAQLTLETGISTRLRNQLLPALTFSLEQQGPLERSHLVATLIDEDDTLSVNATGDLHLLHAQGALKLNAQSPDLSALSARLLPALYELDLLDAQLTVDAGSLELGTQFSLEENWSQQSELAVSNLSGYYGEYRFDGLSLSTAWNGIEQVQTTRPITVSAENLNVGFDITEFNVIASLPQHTPIASPSLQLNTLQATVFGGELLLPEPASWDFAAPRNSLTLQAKRWELGQLVALQQSEDIQAQGVLEGELPVTVADGRLVIEKGFMRALPPGGSIKYVSNDASQALGQSSRELAMALRLLSDFRYDVLSSAVELDATGNLLLGLSLAGRNPQEFDGRQVNFNINLEQNLDPLLQSLRLSGKLTEEIENRLK